MKTDKLNSKIFQYGEVLHTYGTSLSIDINATVATKHLQTFFHRLVNLPYLKSLLIILFTLQTIRARHFKMTFLIDFFILLFIVEFGI